MRNFCSLIGLEQAVVFQFNLKYLHVKITIQMDEKFPRQISTEIAGIFILGRKRPYCHVNPNHSFGKSVCSPNDISWSKTVSTLFLLIEGFRITFKASGKRQIGFK